FRSLVPDERSPQKRVIGEKPFVPFAHHEIDRSIRKEGMQFFDQRSGQHGIAEERGLYDQELLHTATLCSRKASFSEVFLSVLSLRWPMIKAQGTPYSPAGNFFGTVPGITTDRDG